MITADDIRAATDPNTVRAALMALTVPRINALAAELDIWVGGSKPDRVHGIVHHGVERRLTSAAIARGGRPNH